MGANAITPGWLTVKQASQYCGLSERTLFERIEEGCFESRLRGRRLINRESLDAWIRDGEGQREASLKVNAGKGGAA